jgi:hypothetical protein
MYSWPEGKPIAHAPGRLRREPARDLGRVGGVRDQQHVLVVVEVGDQVVDDAPGLGVAAQGVLRLAVPDLPEVVAQRRVDVRRRARTGDHQLAEVADVEDADRLPHRGVLLEHATPGILQRHLPARELRHPRPECDVTIMQRGPEHRHGGEPTADFVVAASTQ